MPDVLLSSLKGFTEAVRILCPVGLFQILFSLFLISCVALYPKHIGTWAFCWIQILLNTQSKSSNSRVLNAWRHSSNSCAFLIHLTKFQVFICTVSLLHICWYCVQILNGLVDVTFLLCYLSALSVRCCEFSRVIFKVRVIAGRCNFVVATKWKDTF